MESLNKVLQLRSDVGKILDELEVMQDNAQTEGRDLNAAEYKIYYSKLDDVHKIKRQEDKIIKEHCLQDELDQLSSGPVERSNPLSGGSYSTATRAAGARDYRSLFHRGNGGQLDRGGFESFNEFMKVIESGRYEPRLEQTRAMETLLPSTGGFAIPPGFVADIMDFAMEDSIVLPRCTLWPMETKNLVVPGWNNFDHSGGDVYGGLSGAWIGEGLAATREQPTMRAIELQLKKLGIFTQVSREMLTFGVDFETQLTGVLSKAISYHLDRSLLVTGTGAGQPLSVLNSPGTLAVNPEPGQQSGVIYENLAAMYSRLHSSCIDGAVWVVHPSVIPDLLSLSIAVGVGGVHVPVLSESGGKLKMLTKDVIVSNKLNSLNQAGDVMLVDFKQYYVGMFGSVLLEKSNVVGWLNDLFDIRALLFADAQGSWPSTFTDPQNFEQGWAVTLAARP